MSEPAGYGLCNRCELPLGEDAEVARAFSGRHPYEHADPAECAPPGDPVEVVRRLWAAFARGGVEEAVALVADDVEWAPHSADGVVLRGRDELAEWARAFAASGRRIEAHPYAFDRRDDCVVVSGFLRVTDGDEVTERHMHWMYRFGERGLARAEAHTSREAALSAV